MRPPGRAVLLILLAFLCWPGQARAADSVRALPDPGDTWVRVKSPNFTLISNADESDVRDLGRRLELLREVIPYTTRGHQAQPALPTYVYVFRDEASFRLYGLQENLERTEKIGFAMNRPDAGFLMVQLHGEEITRLTTCHEFTHLFMRSNFVELPLWLDEGLAEYYATFSWQHRTAKIGTVPAGVLMMLRNKEPMDLRTMFTVNWASPEYNDPGKYDLYYGQSWALVHSLLGGPEARRAQFGAFLDSLDLGLKQLDAFEKVFGPAGYQELADELREYLYRDAYHVTEYTFEQPVEVSEMPVDTLSRAETLWRLGELLAHQSPVHHPAAQAHFDAALEADPRCAPAHAGLGLLAEAREDTAEASRRHARALELAPRDPDLLVRCANFWIQSAARERPTEQFPDALPEPMRLARGLLGGCLAQRPGDAGALALLGRTYRLDPGEVSQGLAALRRASAAMPARMDVLVDLIHLEARAGNLDVARDLVEGHLRDRAGPKPRRTLLEWIGSLEQWAATHPAVEPPRQAGVQPAGNRGKAPPNSIAEPGEFPPPESGVGVRVLKNRGDLRRFVLVYNQAVTAANAKDSERALGLFTFVADSASTPDLRAQARRSALRVRAHLRADEAHALVRAGRVGEAAGILEAILASGEADSSTVAYCHRALREIKIRFPGGK